jgi:Protein of unknown function (DUF3572)
MIPKDRSAPRRQAADEAIAQEALLFLVEEPDRLSRFLGETGLQPDTLRESADSPEMLAAALEYLLADESQLLIFAARLDLAPTAVVQAYHRLMPRSGGDD